MKIGEDLGIGAFDIRSTKVAVILNGTEIYEYDGCAVYDLHVTMLNLVLRGLTVYELKKYFKKYFIKMLNLPKLTVVQDINHMSDIYLVNRKMEV